MATLEEIIAAQQAAADIAAATQAATEAAKLASAQATPGVPMGVKPAIPAQNVPQAAAHGSVVAAPGVDISHATPSAKPTGMPQSFIQGRGQGLAEQPSTKQQPAETPEVSQTQEQALGENPTPSETRQYLAEPPPREASNPFAQQPTEIKEAADHYRSLQQGGASAKQLSEAKGEYAKALETAAQANRQAGGAPPGRSRPMPETGAKTKTMAETFKSGAYNPLNQAVTGLSPEQTAEAQAADVANYNRYLMERGENPYKIGTAKMNARGGLDVKSIPQEVADIHAAEQAAKTQRDLDRIEHDARQAYKEITQKGKGGKGEKATSAEKQAANTKLMEARAAAQEHAERSGASDPKNPTAGMNVDRMRQVAGDRPSLTSDRSSLTSMAQRGGETAKAAAETAAKKEAQPKELSQAERQALEMAKALADQNAKARAWYEQLLERQRQVLDQNQYVYNR